MTSGALSVSFRESRRITHTQPVPKGLRCQFWKTYVEEEEEEEGEQSERGEGPAEAVQSDPEWGERRRVEEEEKGKSSKTIMESIVHETASYVASMLQ